MIVAVNWNDGLTSVLIPVQATVSRFTLFLRTTYHLVLLIFVSNQHK